MNVHLRNWIAVFLAAICPYAVAADNVNSDKLSVKPLLVGIKQAPPFTIKTEPGQWQGKTAELWNHIANDLQLKYEFQETDLSGLLQGVAEKKFDAAIGALTVTADRAKTMDFSHPFYSSGLSIAVPAQPSNAWFALLKGFFT